MTKILLAFLFVLFTCAMVFLDNGASPLEKYAATGTIHTTTQSEFKALKKLANILKKDNDLFVLKCSFDFNQKKIK